MMPFGCQVRHWLYLFLQEGQHVPISVKVGDQVLLPEYGGTKVELEDNKEFHLFRESDILAKIESWRCCPHVLIPIHKCISL